MSHDTVPMHPTTRNRRAFMATTALALSPGGLRAQPAGLQAPNVVPITPRWVTSGQPARESLQSLGAMGFQAVVYLAPGNVSSAVPDEAAILQRQGITFVHIPIPFGAPDESHYAAVAEALNRLSGKKVLVHCEVNMRASSLVFLYRVIALRQPPAEAYEAVAQVWSPRGPWRALIVAMLRKHGIEFEPY
jgi:protein tyrosine phosphatase (PTP) superfamily phosphohydrolase (DUF442 family)